MTLSIVRGSRLIINITQSLGFWRATSVCSDGMLSKRRMLIFIFTLLRSISSVIIIFDCLECDTLCSLFFSSIGRSFGPLDICGSDRRRAPFEYTGEFCKDHPLFNYSLIAKECTSTRPWSNPSAVGPAILLSLKMIDLRSRWRVTREDDRVATLHHSYSP